VIDEVPVPVAVGHGEFAAADLERRRRVTR
jgi:hypothetical protein